MIRQLDLLLHLLLQILRLLVPVIRVNIQRDFTEPVPRNPNDEGFGKEEEGDEDYCQHHQELLEESLAVEVLGGVAVGDEHPDQGVDDGGGWGVLVGREPLDDDQDVHVDEGGEHEEQLGDD